MLIGIVIGFIAVIALRSGYTLYLDIAISPRPRRLPGNGRLRPFVLRSATGA